MDLIHIYEVDIQIVVTQFNCKFFKAIFLEVYGSS